MALSSSGTWMQKTQLHAEAGWRPSFFPAFLDGRTSNHVHMCTKGLPRWWASHKIKVTKATAYGKGHFARTDQLPVSLYNDYSWCQSSLPHCFHPLADKCLYKNAAAVKGIVDSMYVSWNKFCRQSGLCPELFEWTVLQNYHVWAHKNSNHSLDITRILVDFSCYNRKSQLLHTISCWPKLTSGFFLSIPSEWFIP